MMLQISRRQFAALGLLMFSSGCAAWTRSGDQPPPIQSKIPSTGLSNETVAIETILLRLAPEQAVRLEELWRHADQQILESQLRIALDRNGVRAGKLAAVPPVLETWIREIGERQDNNMLEQTGLNSDVKQVSQHLRCRANVVKEISIRHLENQRVPFFYHEEGPKGKQLLSPRFFVNLIAKPEDNHSASVKLSPQVEHGELRSRVVVREAALRNVSEREALLFPELSIQQKLQRGEILVVGPTSDRHGIGAEFFHSLTAEGSHQPVLLLIRFSQSGADSTFVSEEAMRATKASL